MMYLSYRAASVYCTCTIDCKVFLTILVLATHGYEHVAVLLLH